MTAAAATTAGHQLLPASCWFEETRLPCQREIDGRVFPLVVVPKPEYARKTSDDWEAWSAENGGLLKELLLKYRVVVFRDFPLDTPAHFDRFVKALPYEHFPYLGGSAPRTCVVGNVFTTNEAPLDKPIAFHHEMSQQRYQPDVLFFYCDVPAKKGGQTPVSHSHAIYKEMARLMPELVDRMEREGICYTRVMPENDDVGAANGRGWKSTYFATTREEAEVNAGEQGNTVTWLPDGCMKVTSHRPAIRTDPRTGEKQWFNHINQVWLSFNDERNVGIKSVFFPNGDLLPLATLETINAAIEKFAVDYDYRHGDVLAVDNRQALHARRTGEGPRRVVAALCRDTEHSVAQPRAA